MNQFIFLNALVKMEGWLTEGYNSVFGHFGIWYQNIPHHLNIFLKTTQNHPYNRYSQLKIPLFFIFLMQDLNPISSVCTFIVDPWNSEILLIKPKGNLIKQILIIKSNGKLTKFILFKRYFNPTRACNQGNISINSGKCKASHRFNPMLMIFFPDLFSYFCCQTFLFWVL